MDILKNIGQEIEKVAYELWEKCGCLPGREIENWLEAERIVILRYAEMGTAMEEAEKSASFEKMPVELKKAVPRTMKKETPEKKASVRKTTKKTESIEARKGK